jgi:hypothetical protein
MQLVGIRSKIRFSYFLLFINAVGCIALSELVSRWFIVFLVLTAVSIGIYLIIVRCPTCGKPVLYNPVRFLGVNAWIWTSWVPRRCTRCGTPFD